MKDKIIPEQEKFEYNLFINQIYNEIKKEWFTSFRLESTKEFVNFKYEIVIKKKSKGDIFQYKIVGLRTPEFLIPGGGPAVGKWEYPLLHGIYSLEFTNLDRKKNIFEIGFTQKKITLKKQSRQRFINLLLN